MTGYSRLKIGATLTVAFALAFLLACPELPVGWLAHQVDERSVACGLVKQVPSLFSPHTPIPTFEPPSASTAWMARRPRR
jgi:hypothetical protein